MPMPLWWGQINKRLFNPRALVNGKWEVINHVGRSSGRAYRTPLGSWEVDGTRVFVLVYGSRSDWVQNILASGEAMLETRDGQVEVLGSPRIIPGATIRGVLSDVYALPPKFLKVEEYLQMDILSRQAIAATG